MKISSKNIYTEEHLPLQAGVDWKNYFFLLFITLLTYWPLTFGIFSLKNDALLYFLPWRIHISDIIRSGNFPFWDPYLFTGLPLHSEMPSGTWNPLVLFISLFTRYNMSVLQWELLFYIFIGAIGMYKLIKGLGLNTSPAFICAIAYMCCGFMTDSGSFISWINCAAFIPFCFLYFYKTITSYSFIYSLKLGLALFLLFSSCDPSYFILSAYIMALGFLSWIISNRPGIKRASAVLKHILIALLLFIILSAPAILSYLEFLPYYKRGAGASLEQSLTDPFPPFSLISFFIPNAVVKQHVWLNTDIAMRNGSPGIFILLFLLAALSQKLTALQKFICAVSLLLLLFSFGDYFFFREWCYKYLPLMNTFRHPATARLFTTIGIIILASSAIHNYLNGTIDLKRIKKSVIIIATFLLWIVSYYAITNSGTQISISDIKNVSTKFSDFTFADIAIIQGILQLLFIIFFVLFIKRKRALTLLIAVNLVLFANMSLPFTFISKLHTTDVNAYVEQFPHNFPTPSLTDSIESNTYSKGTTDGPYGYSRFYNKRIVIQDNIISPTINSDYGTFLSNKELRVTLNRFPWAFISSHDKIIDSSIRLTVKAFSPNIFKFNVQSTIECRLNIIQQYNRNWEARINNQKVPVEKSNIAFMSIAIPEGQSEVKFEYSPGNKIIALMYISLITLIAVSLFVTFIGVKHVFNHKKAQL